MEKLRKDRFGFKRRFGRTSLGRTGKDWEGDVTEGEAIFEDSICKTFEDDETFHGLVSLDMTLSFGAWKSCNGTEEGSLEFLALDSLAKSKFFHSLMAVIVDGYSIPEAEAGDGEQEEEEEFFV